MMKIAKTKRQWLTIFLVCLLAVSSLMVISCSSSGSDTGPTIEASDVSFIDASTLPKAFENVSSSGISGAPPVEVELDIDMPTFPEQVMVYKLKLMDAAYADEIAQSMGFTGTSEASTIPPDSDNLGAVAFSYTEGDAWLGISYNGVVEAIYGRYPSVSGQVNILSEQECLVTAQGWLKSHHIYPDNVTRISIGPIRQVATVDTETGVISENKITTYAVAFYANIGDYESSGPAAYIEIAENGSIIGVDRQAQRLEPYGYVNLKTPEMALDILETVLTSPLPSPPETSECLVNRRSFDHLSVTDVYLRYSKCNEFVLPIYHFRGDAISAGLPGVVKEFRGRVDAVNRSES
jgi:hypothetical protein